MHIEIQKVRLTILFIITFIITLSTIRLTAQTTIAPGDMAIIGFKTNNSTQGGNDAVKFVTLIDLECGTEFIATDNNWRNNGTWYCSNDEFAYEITVTSQVDAGSVFFLDPDAPSVTVSSGAISFTDLGNPWGTNSGFNSQGDNFFLLQGTRAAPQFIYGFRHNGTFASGGDCGSKNSTSLPSGLTLGTSAIQMSSARDQWHYNCSNLVLGTKAQLRTSISNNANWTNSNGQSWNNSSCDFFVTDAPISGSLGVSGTGCGCLDNCNLSVLGGPNCGASGVSGDCSSGTQNMSVDISVPPGCTYKVYATMRKFTGCSSSGADNSGTGDRIKVDNSSGGKSFITGSGNADIEDSYTMTGPGTIRVSGAANRADEIIVYKVTPVTPSGICTSCTISPLSIELTEFNGTKIDNAVKLNWITTTEINNDYFTIERSTNTENWEVISIVNGAGSSNYAINYNIWDSSPITRGVDYYRLKQTDFDGNFTYSKIISIDFSKDEEKTIIKSLNLLGQEVNEEFKGIVINVYSNGESEKVFRN